MVGSHLLWLQLQVAIPVLIGPEIVADVRKIHTTTKFNIRMNLLHIPMLRCWGGSGCEVYQLVSTDVFE